jgi:hypothetical protein
MVFGRAWFALIILLSVNHESHKTKTPSPDVSGAIGLCDHRV